MSLLPLNDFTSSSYLHERTAAFAQLRTAEPDSVEIRGPSLSKGDWRAFSRVEAHGVRWPERRDEEGGGVWSRGRSGSSKDRKSVV